MTAVPSRRLLACASAVTVGALGLVVFPGTGLLLVTANLLLVGAAVLDWLLTPGPDVLEVERLAAEQMSVLETERVGLRVRNRARGPLRVRLSDTVPESFEVLPAASAAEPAGTVPADGEVRWEYEVRPLRRGLATWGPVHLRYRSLLGLWEFQKVAAAPARAKVYPGLEQLHRYHLLARADRLDVLGVRKVRQRGGAWEFESLRDYADGDDVRRIDWKATARRQKFIVRNHRAERNQTVLLLIDSGRLMNATVAGVSKLDHAVNTALMLAHVALTRGDRVGLCTFSHKVHAWLAPRAHVAQMRVMTEALYDLRGDFTETDHGRCLRFLSAHHSKRALLVVLTDFVDAETSRDMVDHLALAGQRHLVLFAAFRDPFLGEAARARPGTQREGFRKVAAIDLLHDRREVLERLRRLGAHVIDTDPAGVTPPVINQYLEIVFRGLL